jgi:phosphoribosylamine--glycine ligase
MKVLVIGGGGREHALAWKLARSERVQTVFVAPGNGGTARPGHCENLPLTDPRPAGRLCRGREDRAHRGRPRGAAVRRRGRPVPQPRAAHLRPHPAAAQLESSKAFAKEFMQRHGIPTAHYGTFTDAAAAHAYVDRVGAPIVIKADGLAAGKGVVVAMSLAQAHEAVDDMLGANTLGVQHNAGGARVVIEEFLPARKPASSSGRRPHVLPLATSQDHKRLLDGDTGPNTGGMGAYSRRRWSRPTCMRA